MQVLNQPDNEQATLWKGPGGPCDRQKRFVRPSIPMCTG